MNVVKSTVSVAALCFAAFSLFPNRAPAAIELPHGGIFINAYGEAAYTSNLFLTAEEESDVVITVLPSLEYLVAQGLVHFEAHAGVEFLRFIDWSELDTENFKSNFLVSFPHEDRGRTFFFRLNGGFNEITSATAVDGALVQEDELSVGADLEYYFSDRTSARLGASYRDRDARTPGFASRGVTTVRLGPAHEFSERLTLFGTLRYRKTDVSGATPALDSEDYSVIAGAEGRLLALLVGEVAVGVQRRTFDGDFEDQTEPYAFAGLTWEVDEMTEVNLSLTSDMQTSASNLSGQTVLVSLEGVRRVGEKLRFNLGAGYEDSSYVRAGGGKREDDEWSVFGGAGYVLNRHVSLNWDLAFAQRNSSFAASNYDVVRTGLSVDARF